MNTEALEKAIVEQIQGLGIPAEAYLQNPDGYMPSVDPGVVLVRYVGTKYTTADIGGVRKRRLQMIELVVVSKVLRGENGIYTWLDVICRQLEGLVMMGAGGPLELESEEFINQCGETWQFRQRWNLYSKIEYEQQDDYADRSLSIGN